MKPRGNDIHRYLNRTATSLDRWAHVSTLAHGQIDDETDAIVKKIAFDQAIVCDDCNCAYVIGMQDDLNAFKTLDWTETEFDRLVLFFPEDVHSDELDRCLDICRRQYLFVDDVCLDTSGTRVIDCSERRAFKLVYVRESRRKKYVCTESAFLIEQSLNEAQKNAPIETLTTRRLFSEEDIRQHCGHFFDLNSTDCYSHDIQKRGYDPMHPCKEWTVLQSNVDVIDEKTGKCIMKFRKQRIPFHVQKAAYDALLPSAKFTRNSNRGAAGGIVDPQRVKTVRPSLVVAKTDAFRVYPQLPSGGASNAGICNPAKSAIIGWTDIPKRNEKHVPCRLTAYTAEHLADYESSLPFFECIDDVYRAEAPEEWSRQNRVAQKTKARVGNTCFSSITVNYDWRSALHKDVGDYKDGFSTLTACQPSDCGGELLIPEYRIAIRICSGDVLLFDSHLYHCNAPLKRKSKNRLSFVSYLRERIQHVCPQE